MKEEADNSLAAQMMTQLEHLLHMKLLPAINTATHEVADEKKTKEIDNTSRENSSELPLLEEVRRLTAAYQEKQPQINEMNSEKKKKWKNEARRLKEDIKETSRKYERELDTMREAHLQETQQLQLQLLNQRREEEKKIIEDNIIERKLLYFFSLTLNSYFSFNLLFFSFICILKFIINLLLIFFFSLFLIQ